MPGRPRGVVVCTHVVGCAGAGGRGTTMERRNFLIGMGSTAAGASALIGSGAFSRIESHRSVTVQVAEDANAYLGLSGTGSPNSDNYVDTDGDGHLEITITDSGEGGEGVNSDSTTFFDGLFEICNQGKADADISYELPDDVLENDSEEDEQTIAFYYIDGNGDRVIVEEEDEVDLPLGECEEIGLRTVTKGIDATEEDTLIDGDVILTADAPDAGDENGED